MDPIISLNQIQPKKVKIKDVLFHITTATVRKGMDIVARQNLTDFGQYVAECMPKYVQKVQLTAGDELEILIAPEGVLPVLTFLKDHHNAQFASLADICGLDMPTREFRFEVMLSIIQLCFIIVPHYL